MSRWPELRDSNWLERYLGDRVAARYWTRIFDATHAERNSSWAYRWTRSAWVNDALTLIPADNLVSNVAFGEPGIVVEDFRNAGATGQEIEDQGDPDPVSADARFAEADLRVDGDPLQQVLSLHGRLRNASLGR